MCMWILKRLVNIGGGGHDAGVKASAHGAILAFSREGNLRNACDTCGPALMITRKPNELRLMHSKMERSPLSHAISTGSLKWVSLLARSSGALGIPRGHLIEYDIPNNTNALHFTQTLSSYNADYSEQNIQTGVGTLLLISPNERCG